MKTILIVEDNDDLRQLYEFAVQKSGAKCLTASNGQEALIALANCQHLPRLIFTDLIMPILGGAELIVFLKSHPKYAHIPILVCSGYDDRIPSGVERLEKHSAFNDIVTAMLKYLD